MDFQTVCVLLLSFGTLAQAQFECPNEGVFADPKDCQSFYSCDSYHAEHYTCGEGLLFDEEFHVCNFDYEVDCGERPIPGVSTTTITSTTGLFPTEVQIYFLNWRLLI